MKTDPHDIENKIPNYEIFDDITLQDIFGPKYQQKICPLYNIYDNPKNIKLYGFDNERLSSREKRMLCDFDFYCNIEY